MKGRHDVASSKERDRWEKWYAKVTDRMQRQSKSLTRLVMLLTEATAALHEIASLDPIDKEGFGKAQMRAKEALERIEEPAAATTSHAEELTSEAPPEDPRRKY